jgi:hypothetical protein
MAEIWQAKLAGHVKCSVEDHSPTMQSNHAGGVRVELIGRAEQWTIELSRAECERIAELIK